MNLLLFLSLFLTFIGYLNHTNGLIVALTAIPALICMLIALYAALDPQYNRERTNP